MVTNFRIVSRNEPCAICCKPDWCSFTADGGIAICRRIDTGSGHYREDVNGDPYWVYVLNEESAYKASDVEVPERPLPERADAVTLDAVYRVLLNELALTKPHLKNLQKRGLSVEAIERIDYRSMIGKGRSSIAKRLTDKFGENTLLKIPGFYVKEELGRSWISIAGVNGMYIPVRDFEGRIVAIQIRCDDEKKFPKYMMLSSASHGGPGPGAPLHVPSRTGKLEVSVLRITEGYLKADIATELSGVPTIGLPGVSHVNQAVALIRSLGANSASLALDRDARENFHVAKALQNAATEIANSGLEVMLEVWPEDAGKGIDDVLAGGYKPEILTNQSAWQTLAEIVLQGQSRMPSHKPKRELETFTRILGDPPPTLSRPLALIDGHAYAATWLWTEKVTLVPQRAKGRTVDDERIQTTTNERSLYVVRGDGEVFGPDNIDDLELEIKLNDVPPDEKLWRAGSVQAFTEGKRPDYADVFRRVTSVFDHFIDFANSFADQQTMCELSACFSMSTWFADAFTVLGYPWPNGERGSGKSQWGTVWAHTSYLGMVTTMSGSFAALRDLADYGAAILFDDAEHISDPRKADPDKRTLVLAGNRRGTTIPLKEPNPNGRGWKTRWVNAYCPRGFTAINLPDHVLGSRSVKMPLVRTSDPRRANRDPADFNRWPCDRLQLQDDLWATALSLLQEAADVWAELEDESELVGREFEPWRPVIAVARHLERQGVLGLEDRMRIAMRAYQDEKADFDSSDRTIQILRAIVYQVTGRSDVSDVLDIKDVLNGLADEIRVEASKLVDAIKLLGEQEEWDTEWASSRTVGWQLRSLRFQKDKAKTKKRDRSRVVSIAEFCSLLFAYGIMGRCPDKTSEMSETSRTSAVRVEDIERF